MILDKILSAIAKEVVNENDNVIQVILTILSSYTRNPLNLRILAPSGEGKTYIVLTTAQYFPQDNIWIIAEASAKSFRYMADKLVLEIDGEFVPLEEYAAEHYEILSDEFASRKEREIAENTIKTLTKQAYRLLDFTNKTIIFLDSQSFALWETLKTTLSHDSKIRKDMTTNKINGANALQKVVYKGFPAVIYCSAKDEIGNDETDEINTRFNSVSIEGSTAKYEKMLELVQAKAGAFYDELVISKEEKEQVVKLVKQLIDLIGGFTGVFNPYDVPIRKNFPNDKGMRSRQMATLVSNINLLALANSQERYSLVGNGKNLIIVSFADVIQANSFTKKPAMIALTKIQFFNDKIRDAINKSVDSQTVDGAATATRRQIAEYLKTDSKKLYDTYLVPLEEHGYIESIEDSTHTQRVRYVVTPRYRKEKAKLSQTFLEIPQVLTGFTSLKLCLESALNQWVNNGYKIVNSKGETVDLETLLNLEVISTGFKIPQA